MLGACQQRVPRCLRADRGVRGLLRGQAADGGRDVAGPLGPDAAPFGLTADSADGPVEGAQLILVSNNPYTLSSLAGFGSRARLDTGALGVVRVSIDRTSDVHRLVALEAAGSSRALQRLAPVDHSQPGGPGSAVLGRRRGRRGAHQETSSSLHDPAGCAGGSHRPRAIRSLTGLAPHTRRGVHPGRPRPRRVRPTERDRPPPDIRRSVTRPDRAGESPESSASTRTGGEMRRRLFEEADALDEAIYHAVASTPTPTLDVPMTWISNAANDSRLWVVVAGVLAVAGGQRGRRAAIRGLMAIGATSITANLVVKHIFPRRRPTRLSVTAGRKARMPTSSSFPSGHTASAFAFATAVTADLPRLSLPLYALATAVGYSRVHTGVHYPSDVMSGAILGLTVGTALRGTTARLCHVITAGGVGQAADSQPHGGRRRRPRPGSRRAGASHAARKARRKPSPCSQSEGATQTACWHQCVSRRRAWYRGVRFVS